MITGGKGHVHLDVVDDCSWLEVTKEHFELMWMNDPGAEFCPRCGQRIDWSK